MLSLFACSSSSDVVSNRLIQKRKYQKGFHLNGIAHKKNIKSDSETGEVAELNDSERLKSDQLGAKGEVAHIELSDVEAASVSVEIEKPKVKAVSNQVLMKLAISPKKLIKNVPSIAERWYDGIEPDNKSSNNNSGSISLLLSILAFVVTFLSLLLIVFVPFVLIFGILIGLTLAIIAVSIGAKSRRNNDVAKAGVILGWVYIVLMGIIITITVLFLLLLISAFSA